MKSQGLIERAPIHVSRHSRLDQPQVVGALVAQAYAQMSERMRLATSHTPRGKELAPSEI